MRIEIRRLLDSDRLILVQLDFGFFTNLSKVQIFLDSQIREIENEREL